jgi:hypothetical protein
MTKTKELPNQKGLDAPLVMHSVTYEDYISALKIVKAFHEKIENEINELSKTTTYHPETMLFDTNFPNRLLRVLSENQKKLGVKVRWRETRLKDLEGISMSKFAECRNVGKQSVIELSKLLLSSGVNVSS